MKFLLIDNGTTLLRKLERALPGETTVRAWNDVRGVKARDYDAIVLSGGSLFEIVGNEKRLTDEIREIHRAGKLLIGICFGCELVAEAFGARLVKGTQEHKGVTTIRVIDDDEIFDGQKQFSVYERHRWLIKQLPEDFILMAESDHGIELFRHKHRPMYGLQFHPEQFEKAEDGERILLNILKRELE